MKKILHIEELNEPYNRLTEILTLEEIFILEEEFRGLSINFRKNIGRVEEEHPELCKLFGIEKAYLISIKLIGYNTYFPEIKNLSKIKDLISKDFNGYNYIDLAKKYGYSARHIRRILEGVKPNKEENHLQMNIFELLS